MEIVRSAQSSNQRGAVRMENDPQVTSAGCAQTYGTLPSCAPLANPYVPFQQSSPETYQAAKGVVRGTMYPGLDLPFRGMVNETELKRSALHDLQTMSFAITELGLYLDTHSDDAEAVALFNRYVEQYADSMQQYEREYGSLTQMGAALNGTYDWLKSPWPWEYTENQEV